MYFPFCVAPSGNINNDNYNNDNNGVRPFWWIVRQSRHQPKSVRHIKRTHNLSEWINKGAVLHDREKFDEYYGAWKNHISHGNCGGLARDMDKAISKVLSGG